MNTIKFNNLTLQVESYNKNTYFDGATVNSTASCSVVTSDLTALNELAEGTITTIQIYHDDTLIYDLQDINCRITNISEYLSEARMNITINLVFDYSTNS